MAEITPDLIDRCRRFLSYAADKRAPDLVLMERFKLDRGLAAAIVKKLQEAPNGQTS